MALPEGFVAVVTGASRGVGKGIALALGAEGATVYVTGRTLAKGTGGEDQPGSLEETAAAITERGGQGIAVGCDHRQDAQVEALFDQVRQEQGRLDLLVNNAAAIPSGLTQPGGFWEKSLDLLAIMDVGMRSHYVASYYAAPLMVAAGKGLIVHTSSAGGRCYMHGPAYGGGKAAVDKFANDMAVDLRPHGVAVVSLWMGLVRTEKTMQLFDRDPDKYGPMLAVAESAEFPGRVIAALATDAGLMDRSGQILVAAEVAQELGIKDTDGKQPPSPAAWLGAPAQANPAVVH